MRGRKYDGECKTEIKELPSPLEAKRFCSGGDRKKREIEEERVEYPQVVAGYSELGERGEDGEWSERKEWGKLFETNLETLKGELSGENFLERRKKTRRTHREKDCCAIDININYWSFFQFSSFPISFMLLK